MNRVVNVCYRMLCVVVSGFIRISEINLEKTGNFITAKRCGMHAFHYRYYSIESPLDMRWKINIVVMQLAVGESLFQYLPH